MAVTAYSVLSASSAGDLQAAVTAAIAAGKQPFGAPYAFDGFMHQAMIEGSQVLVGDAGADGSDATVNAANIAAVFDALPTADPADGTYWLNSGVVTKGTGP